MTKYFNTAEGGTDGTAVSTGNSGGASGTAWDQVTNSGGGSTTFEADAATHGSMGYSFAAVSASSNMVIKNITAPSGEAAISVYFIAPASTPTANAQIASIRHSSGNMGILALTTANKLVCQDATGANAFTPTPTLTAGVKYRAEMRVKKGTGTTDGERSFAYFVEDSTTPVYSNASTTANSGTTDPTSVRYGRLSGSTWANTLYMDSMQWDDAPAGALIGPWTGGNFAPTGSISTDKTTIEPGETFTLTITDADSDGTVTTRDISQTAGTTTGLTGSGGSGSTRTGEGPYTLAGTTLQYNYVVTDDDGATSSPATVSINVLAATERIVTVGGSTPTEVPLKVTFV